MLMEAIGYFRAAFALHPYKPFSLLQDQGPDRMIINPLAGRTVADVSLSMTYPPWLIKKYLLLRPYPPGLLNDNRLLARKKYPVRCDSISISISKSNGCCRNGRRVPTEKMNHSTAPRYRTALEFYCMWECIADIGYRTPAERIG